MALTRLPYAQATAITWLYPMEKARGLPPGSSSLTGHVPTTTMTARHSFAASSLQEVARDLLPRP